MADKCTEEIKVRVTPEMRDQIKDLAFADDRAPSEYIRHVLACHLYGHARKAEAAAEKGTGPNVPSQGPRNISRPGKGDEEQDDTSAHGIGFTR